MLNSLLVDVKKLYAKLLKWEEEFVQKKYLMTL